MSTTATIALLALAYLFFFVLERVVPLRRPKARLLPRLWVNVAISTTAFAAAALLVRPAAGWALGFAQAETFGLMRFVGLGGLPEVIATFALMDLTFYYWHIANHRVPFLWRIHNVHHIDPDLDVTTGFRFHFAEVGLSAGFRAVQVLLIGPSLTAFFVYEVAFQTGTLFHHSNIRLPYALERRLVRLLVTPRMHGIHHSDYRDETNSNFGVVFPWWDRLHATMNLGIPQQEITIGIPAYSNTADNRLLHALALPFEAQRNYWRAGGKDRIRRSREGASRRLAE